jgi:hypothetical protein
LIDKEDAIRKSIKANEVRQRIQNAEEGLADEGGDEDDDWDEDEDPRARPKKPTPPGKK